MSLPCKAKLAKEQSKGLVQTVTPEAEQGTVLLRNSSTEVIVLAQVSRDVRFVEALEVVQALGKPVGGGDVDHLYMWIVIRKSDIYKILGWIT